MFLLVCRHLGAHLGGHQHGVSIQISINMGNTFLRISFIRKIAVAWILARVFAYLPSFFSQILDLTYWTVLIFNFDLLWMAWHWKPTIAIRENEEVKLRNCYRHARDQIITINRWYNGGPLWYRVGLYKPFQLLGHSCPQSLRSLWSGAGIDSFGLVQHRRSAIYGLPIKSGKSDWLRKRKENSAHTQKIGSGQSSNLVPRAHVPFGQHQDTELWNNQQARSQSPRVFSF